MSTKQVFFAGLFGAGLLSLAGCGAGTGTAAVDPEALGSTTDLTYAAFRDLTLREPGTGAFIVDGDIVLHSEEALRDYFESHVRPGALIVHQAGGVDARWTFGQRLNLTYCVSTAFGANYNRVVQAMAEAAGAWSSAANVRFAHASGQDAVCTSGNASVVFDVNPVNVGGAYLARAFFPNDARVNRNVLIDTTAFGNTAPYTLAGILRHELGHTLGFRHEHTRPEARTCFEDNNWRVLTPYDAASVMHYPQCNGTNRGDLVLTATDIYGAKALYGGNFFLQTGTPLHETDATTAFALHPVGNDLFIIRKSGTGSGTTEVHVLSAASNYQQYTVHAATPLEQTGADWSFAVAANRDVFAIRERNGGSGTLEVHVLTAASGYSQFSTRTGTGLGYVGDNWEFEVTSDNRDLVAIAKNTTGSGRTEVHTLSAVSNYQTFTQHIATGLGATDDTWDFSLLSNRDLVAVQRTGTASGSTERRVLTAASGYQTTSLVGATPFSNPGTNWSFLTTLSGDLMGVLRSGTGTHSTEVHLADMP